MKTETCTVRPTYWLQFNSIRNETRSVTWFYKYKYCAHPSDITLPYIAFLINIIEAKRKKPRRKQNQKPPNLNPNPKSTPTQTQKNNPYALPLTSQNAGSIIYSKTFCIFLNRNKPARVSFTRFHLYHSYQSQSMDHHRTLILIAIQILMQVKSQKRGQVLVQLQQQQQQQGLENAMIKIIPIAVTATATVMTMIMTMMRMRALF